MHRTIKITVMILLWIFVAAFVVVFDRRAARHRAETKVRALAVDIVDSLRDETLVSSDAVRRWIAGSKIATVGVPLAEVDLAGIEQAILRNGFVERANAYVTYDGELRVENHKGILAYGREEIHISGGVYLIKIAGQGLELRAMTGIELLITGKISQITLA